MVEHPKLLPLVTKYAESAEDTLRSLTTDDINLDFLDEESSDKPDESSTQEIDDAPVVRFIQKMLLDAINDGASDIHFEPYEKFYRIRFRVDGILREIATPPLAIKEKIASRIKVISRLNIAEKRVPQDGRMKLVLSQNRAIDFRVSTLPTMYGEKIVLRILDPPRPLSASTRWAMNRSSATCSCRRSPALTAWCWSPARPDPARPFRSTPA